MLLELGAKFLVPDWGDIVDTGRQPIWPSRPVSVCQLYARVDHIYPPGVTKNLATGLTLPSANTVTMPHPFPLSQMFLLPFGNV